MNAQPSPAVRRPYDGGGLVITFAIPLAMGLIAGVLIDWWWFSDLDAVLCGAWRAAHQISPYAQAVACPGGRPAAYMYLPQFAWMLAPLTGGPDVTGLRWLFGTANFAIVAGLIHVLFLRPMEGAPRGLRAPILALTSGTAVASANIAFGCHALVLSAALLRRRAAWPLILAIVAVSFVKPIFLVYLLVFAYEDERLAVRAGRMGAGLGLAAIVAVAAAATGGPQMTIWRDGLNEVALGRHIGFGFLSWTALAGLRPTDRIAEIGYVGFAGLVSLAGLAIAEVRKLSPRARTLLALGVAQLLNPRLMIYDVLMLAPLAVAFHAVPEAWRKSFAYAVIAVGALAFAIQLSRIYELVRLAPALLALLFLASAALAVGELVAGRDGAASGLRVAPAPRSDQVV